MDPAYQNSIEEIHRAARNAKVMAERLLQLRRDLAEACKQYIGPFNEDGSLRAAHESLRAVISFLHDQRFADEARPLIELTGALEDVAAGLACPMLTPQPGVPKEDAAKDGQKKRGRRKSGVVKMAHLTTASALVSYKEHEYGTQDSWTRIVAKRLGIPESTLISFRKKLTSKDPPGACAKALFEERLGQLRESGLMPEEALEALAQVPRK